MIRTSKHSLQFTNPNKLKDYKSIHKQYFQLTQYYIDYLWNNKIETTYKDKIYICDIKNKKYDLLSMLSTTSIPLPTNITLSARLSKCSITQAIGIVKAVISKHHKRINYLKLHQKEKNLSKLQSKIDKTIITKPIIKLHNFSMELNSIIADYKEIKSKEFNGYIILSSLGIKGKKITLPIKYTQVSNKWKSKGNKMNSYLFGPDYVDFRWEIKPSPNTNTLSVGADGGQTTCLTLSDGNITTKCIHNHDYKSICNKLARKKRGSKNFQKAVDHRDNYVNWSIKQLNLGQYKEIRFESNKNIKYKNKKSRSLQHWSWTKINQRIEQIAEEHDVHVVSTSSIYKSQRCSSCGFVHKSSRQGKIYKCKSCGFTTDSDINGALNNSINLPRITQKIFTSKINRTTGFFWKPSGLFALDGTEFTDPFKIKQST